MKNYPGMCVTEWKAGICPVVFQKSIPSCHYGYNKERCDRNFTKIELEAGVEILRISEHKDRLGGRGPVNCGVDIPDDTDYEQTLVWGCLGSGPHHLLLKMSQPHCLPTPFLTHWSPVSITSTVSHPPPCQLTYLIRSF